MPNRLSRALSRPFRRTAADFRDPKRGTGQKVLIALALAFMAFSVVVLGFVLYAITLIPRTPSAAELRQQTSAQPSIVLAADGSQLAQFERLNRVWVPLDSVSNHFLRALLAVEDQRFFEHGGVDWRRTVGAGLRTVSGRTEGGSTLTQQLARNLYPDDIGRRLTVRRKLRELITARRIERSHGKEEILEAYVNTVPFLYNAFGVEMAARTYFDTHAADLDAAQSATLVGMLKGTSYYNPVRHPERARERRNLVLRLMARRGVLEPAEAEALRAQDLGLDFERQEGLQSEAPHFTRFVREWLSEWADRHGRDLYADGLTIHTTLDPALQRAAEEAVRRRGEQLQQAAEAEWGPGFSGFWARHARLEERALRGNSAFRTAVANGVSEAAMLDSIRTNPALRDSLRALQTRLEVGFVALEPRTGHVKAWVGSRDYGRAAFDHVWQARRQPGSTFKPFVYAAALQRGFQPSDTFVDEERDLPIDGGRRVWRPANAGRSYTGEPMSLTEGLAYSLNTVTAQLMLEVGPQSVVRVARDMGVRESQLEAVPALALGVSEVTLLELVTAYATLANEGQYHPAVPVTRIQDRQGRVIAEFGSPSERALPRDVAQTLTLMLRGAIDRGTGRRIRGEFGITADVAGKTGTTQNGADGWFVLMHPDLVAGAWVGFPEPTVTFRTSRWGSGARNALPIVGDVFRQAALSDRRFAVPARYQDPESIWQRARSWWDGLFDEGAPEGMEGWDYDYDFPELDLEEPEFGFDGEDLDPLDEEDLDALEGDPEDGEAEDGAGPPQEGPTAVQRLYERAGEPLPDSLRR